jgi:signal transduction histidine kinase
MRLADFIRTNTEKVLVDWEQFARSISPNPEMTALDLRDNAKNMLAAIADDMETLQNERQRHEKAQGDQVSVAVADGDEVDAASEVHARERANSGFELVEMVSEYRALRASVTRLWFEQAPADSAEAREDIRRFHEAVDQSMAIAIRRYAKHEDRSRQIFLAILGHDLRNPLSAIAMNARLLTESPSGNTDIAEIGEGIASSARAMDGIIQDLLVFAGGQLGASMPLDKEDVDLRALVRDVARETRSYCSSCSVRVEDASGDLSGWWDAGWLRQMLSNLLGNAIQHGDGIIEIAAEAQNGDVLLTVRNGGKPIPPALLPFIFNPLVRPHSPGELRRGSLGLGLYIAKEVVKAHGGAINVESKAETGTVFTIRLPRRAEVAA